MRKIWFVLISMILLFTACGEIEQREILIPPDYTIAIDSNLEPILLVLESCAVDSDMGFFYIELISGDELDISAADLIIWWGELESLPEFAVELGHETVVMITSIKMSAFSMMEEQVINILNGSIKSWQTLTSEDEELQLFLPFTEDSLNRVLRQQLGLSEQFPATGHLTTSAADTLFEIGQNAQGIGLIPAAWLNEDVKTVWTGEGVPVVALANAEPVGALHEALVCLQNGPVFTELQNLYPEPIK